MTGPITGMGVAFAPLLPWELLIPLFALAAAVLLLSALRRARGLLWRTLAFAVLALAAVLALWRLPRTPAGFAAATALLYLFFVAFNKQAMANYYVFVLGALCCAVAATLPETTADERPLPARGTGRE